MLTRKRLRKVGAVLALFSTPGWVLAQASTPTELFYELADGTPGVHVEILSWVDDERPERVLFTMPDGRTFDHVVTDDEWGEFRTEDLYTDDEGWTHGRFIRNNGFPEGERFEYKHRQIRDGVEIEFAPMAGTSTPVRVFFPCGGICVWGLAALALCLIAQNRAQDQCLEDCARTCKEASVESCKFRGTCGVVTSCEAKCQVKDKPLLGIAPEREDALEPAGTLP